MSRLGAIRILTLIGLGIVATAVSAQRQTRCWWDDNGRYTCSDSVPPEDARFDRTLINDQGVVVGTEEGEITDEERLAMEEKERAERAAEEARQEQLRYDQYLLDSFLTVEAIERVRDRNIEVFESQARVVDFSLRNLKKKLGDLLEQAERFAPYSPSEDAPPIPVNLSDDIVRTEGSIKVREQMLDEIHQNQKETEDDYNRQIERFRQITGSVASGVSEAPDATLASSEGADDL